MKILRDIESSLKPKNYLYQAWQISWIKRFWPLLLIPLAIGLTEQLSYAVNLTGSLPQRVWLIVYKKTPKKGDYVLFKPPLDLEVPRGTVVIKQIVGISGDTVTRMDQDFFINNEYIATAKKQSLKGLPLMLGPTGILGKSQYFVFSPHPDSLDSRYQQMGWVKADQIIGVAYPLW